MIKLKRMIVRSWSALLRCRECGHEQERDEYGTWAIGSSTIARCPNCGRTTNHIVAGQIADMAPYEKAEAILEVRGS